MSQLETHHPHRALSTHTCYRPHPNRDISLHFANDGAYLVRGSQQVTKHYTAYLSTHDLQEATNRDMAQCCGRWLRMWLWVATLGQLTSSWLQAVAKRLSPYGAQTRFRVSTHPFLMAPGDLATGNRQWAERIQSGSGYTTAHCWKEAILSLEGPMCEGHFGFGKHCWEHQLP